MATTSYSPQVVKCVSSASDLATKLRKVMSRIETCQTKHMPIPVKLSRRAEVLLVRVQEWQYGSSTIDDAHVDACPLRFKQVPDEDSASPAATRASSTSSSPPRSNPSPFKKKRSSLSFDTVLRSKYQKSWKKTKNNQEKLVSSLRR